MSTPAEVEFSQCRDRFKDDPEGLWWAILLAALQGPDTERNRLRTRLAAILTAQFDTTSLKQKVVETLPEKGRRIFLLDGIETAFAVSEIYRFVESLFLFLLALQADDRFANKVEIKLFLRTDLASRSVQNLERQVAGRTINLFWDYQKILNFLLSRLPQLRFYRHSFGYILLTVQARVLHIIRVWSTVSCMP